MILVRVVLLLLALFFLSMVAQAGTYDEPEIVDPTGDTEISWIDIDRVWIEHGPFDEPAIQMALSDFVPTPPDLRTGGWFTGPYYRVDFDLVDWNGTRIGNRDDQHVAISIEETMVITYVCVWDEYDRSACEDGFGCCYDEMATIRGSIITWKVDFKEPLGENWTVGSGYRFENLSARTELRTLRETVASDLAPDEGTSESASAPAFYQNIQTAPPPAPAGPPLPEKGTLAAGVAIVTGLLAGIGRFVFKMGRYRLLRWSVLYFLFSRIQRHEALHHERRAAVFNRIKSEPGIPFSDLRRSLGIGSGSLAYHLKVLEQQGLVGHVRDGRRSRFYVRGAHKEIGDYLSHTQQTLLETVQEHPGATTTRIAGVVGLPRHSVQYHMGRLKEKGRIRKKRQGRHVHYYA